MFKRCIVIVVAVASFSGVAGLVSPASATHLTADAPNDPLFADQWGLAQIRAEEAWDRSTGAGATIAVVDSGIDLDHEDLAGKVRPGNTFVSCGDAGCGNGDWADPIEEPATHGTHVAGIAAAKTDNGIGVAGVAPDASLLAVRVTGFVPLVDSPCFAESWKDTARGIRYAVDNGANVINISLGNPIPGAGTPCTLVETEVASAVAYAAERDVLVVAAAGNETMPLCSGPPGNAPGALCVTATTSFETPAAYSNLGLKADQLAVAAPGGDVTPICGEGVLSTVPPGTANAANAETCGYPSNLAYEEMSGTSMASPHVAGVAALLSAQGCTRTEILDILTSTSRQPVVDARGVFTPSYGWGIVDADAATASAASSCTPRPNLAPTLTDDQVTTNEDTATVVAPLANDVDADGDALTVTSVSSPANGGSATLRPDGTVAYEPARDYHGADAFTYTVRDARGAVATGNVLLTVASVNDAPVAGADAGSTRPDRELSLPVLTNDRDVDGDALAVAAVQKPANGTATIVGGTVRYTAAKGFRGTDRFTYVVSDGAGGTATGVIEVKVAPSIH